MLFFYMFFLRTKIFRGQLGLENIFLQIWNVTIHNRYFSQFVIPFLGEYVVTRTILSTKNIAANKLLLKKCFLRLCLQPSQLAGSSLLLLLMVCSWFCSGLLVGKNKSVYPRQEFISLCHGKLLLNLARITKLPETAMATFNTFSAKMRSKFFKMLRMKKSGPQTTLQKT